MSALEPVRISLPELFDAARERVDDGFDPASSPLHERVVFIVGAPRSGTTWLHQLLAVHPDIATGGEAHVVCEGVAPLFANHDNPDPYMYLSTWVQRGELVGLVRQLIDGIFLRGREALRPSATHVLDKTPNHDPHAALLAELYPDATYVHIIRDGRDVAASSHDLWSSFGEAYATVGASARVWRDAIQDVRAHLGGLRYMEVRYEELLRDTERGLGEILAFAGLRHDEAFVKEAVEFGRPPINVRPSKSAVSERKWADAGPDHERAVFDAAGDLMVSLGYASDADRTAALGRRTWRSTIEAARNEAVHLATGAARRARAVAARRGRKRQVEAVDVVRRAGQALAERLVAGADPGSLLPSDVRGDVDGVALEGRAALVAALEGIAGGRIASVAADTEACLVQLVDAGGQRRLHRYFVRAGVVERVVAE